MNLTGFSDYRSYLRYELEKRIARNPGLSLRGFAGQIGVSPAHLSRVLKGERRISFDKAHAISLRLGHSDEERSHFSDLIQLESESEKVRHSALERVARRVERHHGARNERKLPIEIFKVIADWQHFAILSLTRVQGFQADPKWISTRIGISQLEAKLALERLQSVGLLEIKEGRAFVQEPDVATTDDISSAAIQSNHLQNMEKAAQALTNQPPSLREFQNTSLALKRSQLKRAKEKIRVFITEFIQEFEAQEADEVYQLNLQFFSLFNPKPATKQESL